MELKGLKDEQGGKETEKVSRKQKTSKVCGGGGQERCRIDHCTHSVPAQCVYLRERRKANPNEKVGECRKGPTASILI